MKLFILRLEGTNHAFAVDESSYLDETSFEAAVVKCLSSVYPRHVCVVFGGNFELDGETRRADLALVARDLSHWFVIEVELLSHSLDGHVLPQVRALRFGDLSSASASGLADGLAISLGQAKTLVERVPRATAVISNGFDERWSVCLSAIDVQYLSILPYKSSGDAAGFEVQGELEISKRSLGFGNYDAVASAIRMLAEVDIPDGDLAIEGPDGILARWTARREKGRIWLLKTGPRLQVPNASYLQIMRSSTGKLSLKI